MTSRPNLAAAALALAATGCAHSPPTTLLTLDQAPPAGPARADYRGPPMVVPAVRVPAALDRVEYAHETLPGVVRIEDFARWSAPLGLLAREALVRDLTARLPAGSVLPPGAGGGAGTRTLSVTILSFQPSAAGATMEVAWRWLPDGRPQLASFRAAEAAADPAAASRAFSLLLGQLADAITAAPPP